MKKMVGGCFTALGVIFALLIVLAFGCSSSDDKSKETEVQETAAQSETSAKEDGEAAAEKKEETAASEKSSDTAQDESKSESNDEGSTGSNLAADFVRPEFQEFIDAYLAFYREYADYMNRYNENPTDSELMLGLADLMSREAEMVKAMEGWEAEDLTAAEQALLVEAEAEVLRITAGIAG